MGKSYKYEYESIDEYTSDWDDENKNKSQRMAQRRENKLNKNRKRSEAFERDE